jgi:hypothetical protein
MAQPVRRYPGNPARAFRAGVRPVPAARSAPPRGYHLTRPDAIPGIAESSLAHRMNDHTIVSTRFISYRVIRCRPEPPKVISVSSPTLLAESIPATIVRTRSILSGSRYRVSRDARVAWRAGLPSPSRTGERSVSDTLGGPAAPRYQPCRSVVVRTHREPTRMLIVVECVHRSHSPAHIAPSAIRRTALGRIHQPCWK